jgi:hypothetical protein
MKKLVPITVIILLSATMQASALSVSAGAAGWYTWWNPGDKTATYDPGFLYGPAVSVSFNNGVSLNTVFYFGELDAHANTSPSPSITCSRRDSDTSLSYSINENLRILAGFKYMYYKMKFGEITSPFYVPASYVDHESIGPAAGIIFTFPLTESISFSTGVSGIYVWTSSTGTAQPDETNKDCGYSATASLSYYIDPASVTLNLGVRYQYFKSFDYSSNAEDSNI